MVVKTTKETGAAEAVLGTESAESAEPSRMQLFCEVPVNWCKVLVLLHARKCVMSFL